MSRLTADELAHFRTEGFLVAHQIIPPPVIFAVQDEISRAVDEQARALQAAGKLSDVRADLGFLHRTTALYQQCPDILRPVSNGTHAGPALFRLLTCPDLLDVVEQLMGPEIVASSVYRIRPKLPFWPNGEVPWHQDSGYFHTMGDAHLILTVWVPLMDATVETGAMEVIPRSHRDGVRRHFWATVSAPGLTVHPDHLPDTPPVPVPANVGDAVLMTNLTVHHSTPNTSGRIRWAADLRYNPPAAGNYYPYEAEFIARSPSRPDTVLRDWRAFRELRRTHQPNGVVDRTWKKQPDETFIKPIRL